MTTHLLKRLLGVKYPIIQAPMAGGMTNPNLVSEVCNSDALGFLASGYIPASTLEKQILETKSKTSKPFGFNIFLTDTIKNVEVRKQTTLIDLEKKAGIENPQALVKTSLDEQVEEKIELAAKHGIPIISFTFGIPDRKLVNHLHSKKIHVIGTATNIREALELEKGKVDSVILQGTEAGGHRGSFIVHDQSDEVGLISLLQAAKQKLSIPFFAAGGIATGQGLLSCRILGAEAACIGTAFLVSHESSASSPYKNEVLKSGGQDTVITDVISGKKARGVKNELIEKMNHSAAKGEPLQPFPIQNALSKDLRAISGQKGYPQYQSLWCGQSLECLKQISASEIIQNIYREYEESLKNLAKLNL